MQDQTPLTILGGGPAGLAVAYYAHRQGVPFKLFEAAAAFGGLCHTFRWGAHAYDSGAHRFHDRDSATTADLRQLLGADLAAIKAPSRVWIDGKLIDFPPTPLNLFLSVGIRRMGRIAWDLLRARAARKSIVSFADFAIAAFGKTLARQFLLNYSEKLWGLPAEQLSPQAATRRLSGMTVRTLLAELLNADTKDNHIDGEFLYPRGGYGRIAEALVRSLPSGDLKAQHRVVRIDCESSRIIQIRFSGQPAFSPSGRVVSTLPLTLLVRLLGDALPQKVREAAGRLRFRHIRLVFIQLAQTRVSDNASIYVPDPSLCMSRIYEPKNRSAAMAPADETALVAEVPCSDGDPLFALPEGELTGRVIGELAQIGLVDPGRIVRSRHHLLSHAYPVYSLDYAENVRIILGAIQILANLDCLGRSGTFFYSHLHDQMRMARDYAEDYRRRQESGVSRRQENGALRV